LSSDHHGKTGRGLEPGGPFLTGVFCFTSHCT
jgi:hypothetical protein